MNKFLKIAIAAGFVAVLLAVPFMGGWYLGKTRTLDRMQPRTDTVTVYRDTTITETVFVDRWHVRTDTVKLARVDTLTVSDSVLVEVPIEQKVYRDTLYTAWVSGFRPVLDSIRLTTPTVYITTTVKEPVPVRGLGWGITAGPGVFYADRIRAGIGITAGVTYRF